MARPKKSEPNITTTRVVNVIQEYSFGKVISVGDLSFFLSEGLSTTHRMIADALDDNKIEMIGGGYRLVK